ncbi:MAG: hemolysin family protein [Bacteroidota bacterium]
MVLQELILILALIGINALLAASEIAIVSVRKSRIRQLVEEGNATAARVLNLIENPSGFLATVQLGVTLSGFMASAVGAISLVAGLRGLLLRVPLLAGSAGAISLFLVTTAIAIVSVIFGELIPKRLAIDEAEKISLMAARPIDFLARVAGPIIGFLAWTTNAFLALLGSKQRVRLPSITEDELRSLVESAADEGVVERSESEMIDDIFDFGDTTVHEIMTPRIDIVSVERGTPLEEAIPKFFSSGHARLPIYEGNLDTIVGVLLSQDALQFWHEGGDRKEGVEKLARNPLFVPEQKKISELLSELQESKVHMAIVVDEYGGTAGLVTIEDILEEIVGEIRSEHETAPESQIERLGPDQAIVSGRLSIEDLDDLFDLELQKERGVDTIGGMVYAKLGRIPQVGEKVELPGATLEVLELAGKRIRRIRITRRET